MASDHEVPCEPSRIVELGRFETTRLPLWVRARDCHGEDHRIGPVLPPYPPTPEYEGPIAPCASVVHVANPLCEAAQAEVSRLRGEIAPLCEQMSRALDEVLRLQHLGASFLTAAMFALLAGAAAFAIPVFGWLIGLALIAAGLLLLAWSIVYYAYAAQAERSMNELRARVDGMLPAFDAAVARAQGLCRCPGELVVDTSHPC